MIYFNKLDLLFKSKLKVLLISELFSAFVLDFNKLKVFIYLFIYLMLCLKNCNCFKSYVMVPIKFNVFFFLKKKTYIKTKGNKKNEIRFYISYSI